MIRTVIGLLREREIWNFKDLAQKLEVQESALKAIIDILVEKGIVKIIEPSSKKCKTCTLCSEQSEILHFSLISDTIETEKNGYI